MKKLLFFISIAITLYFTLTQGVHAVTPTGKISPTVTPGTEASASAGSKIKQIEDLKDRLATKVAELQQIQREAIFGKVKSTSVSTVTLSTLTKDFKIDLVNTIKVYQMLKGKRTELTSDDIAKDDVVTVFGDYDSTLDLMKAKLIFIEGTLPTRITGVVSAVDKTEYTITLKDASDQSYTVDYETYSKTFDFTSDKGIVKSGFSKIVIGSFVSVLANKNSKDPLRVSAIRILNYTTTASTPAVTSTPIPSGKTTPTPTVKNTPTPTTKTIKTSPTATP